MDTATVTILVLLTGLAGLWKAIPVGAALELNGYLLAVAAAGGSVVSVILLFSSGVRFKSYLLAKLGGGRIEKKAGSVRKLFNAYGIAGLSVVGTVLLGPQLTLLLGLGVTRAHKKLLYYVLCCTLFWSAVITGVSVVGLDYVRSFI